MSANRESVLVTVKELVLDPETEVPIVILTSSEPECPLSLPMWCGVADANALALELEGIKPDRPMTHDLLNATLTSLGARILCVEIDRMENSAFCATIYADAGGNTHTIDSRPSDAISLALRSRSPIYIARHILEANGIQRGNGIAAPTQASSKPATIKVVFSYSHKDEELRDQLDAHLKLLHRRGLMSMWNDRKILGGERWTDHIDRNFAEADLIVLLVSADFLASDYCYENEMSTALNREAKGEVMVAPVILRACDWTEAPFRHLQALPKDGRPITSWHNRDEAWNEVVVGIKELVEECRLRKSKKQR